MAGFFDTIKAKYVQGGIMWQLLIVNVGVFLALRCVAVVLTLTGVRFEPLLTMLAVPADVQSCLMKPWTFITYMFVHYDFFHIAFNMLSFYWFAKLFLMFFNPKQMFALYVYGGLGGALLYILSYNIFPYFASSITGAYMVGASASILAIIVAVAVKEPDYEIGLLFLGRMPIKWLAVFTLIIDFISIIESNAGGHIAHIGGALTGFVFAYFFKKGNDITEPFNRMMDWIVTQCGRFRGKPFSRVTSHSAPFTRRSTSSNPNRPMSQNDEAELNVILEKIKRSGYGSLTESERRTLFDINQRRFDNN